MTKEEKFIVYISQFGFSNNKITSIIKEMKDVSIESFIKLCKHNKAIKREVLDLMIEKADDKNLEKYIASFTEQGVKLLTRFSEGYDKFAKIMEAPNFIFYKGDLSLLDMPAVAIVGTRNPTNYGRIQAERFAGELARAGIVIISGLAYGIDSIGHRKALEVGGKTVAVLGGGLNKLYPADHADLAREISEKGLLMSEFPMDFRSSRYTFPQRNRIVAGLSDGVLIVEGDLKSGTKHTKNQALEMGITVYAIPGNVNSDKSDLPNHIIKFGEAQCVTEPADILRDFGVKSKPREVKQLTVQLGETEQKVVDLLAKGPQSADVLSEKCKINVISLNSYLTMMEINGIIKKMPGGDYSLI